MSNEIDFLKGQKGASSAKTNFFRSLKVGSIVILLTYFLFIAAVFSYWFFLGKQLSDISQQIVTQKNKVNNLKEVESLQVVLKQKLSILNKFFLSQKGQSFNNLLSYISQISAQIKIKDLKMGKDKINLSGSSPSIPILEKFLQELKNDKSLTLFSQITLSSLDRQEDGNYFFNLILEVKK